MPATRTARPNRFAGRCARCGNEVASGAGLLTGRAGAWTVTHVDGACVAAVVQARTPEPEVGMYLVDATVVKVVQARTGSGRSYAKVLHPRRPAGERWEYVGRNATYRGCTPARMMTFEQAVAIGHAYGICACCGADLDDPESVAAGIGPVCVRRFGMTRREVAATMPHNRRDDAPDTPVGHTPDRQAACDLYGPVVEPFANLTALGHTSEVRPPSHDCDPFDGLDK